MSPTEPVIADEAARERRYHQELQERARLLAHNTASISRNTWTTQKQERVETKGQFIGRVALKAVNNEFLDGAKDFYIGSSHHQSDDYEVFSWAAPIACTYFRKSASHHELCEVVAGVRVFVHRAGSIVDYQDEAVEASDIEGPLFPRASLSIPKAPQGTLPEPRQAPTEAGSGAHPHTLEAVEPRHAVGHLPSVHSDHSKAAEAPDSAQKEPQNESPQLENVPGPPLRAPQLLLRQLSAPKAPSMASVLSTIQSDQYDAITRPVAESQVIQGHPGTGKTIIGTHRAAYLLNPEAPTDAAPRRPVLIVGPTAEYVKHIEGVLRNLIPDTTRYVVKALPQFLDELAGMPPSDRPTESVLLENVSLELARLVDVALARSKSNLDGEKPSDEDVYAELKWLADSPPDTGLAKEWFHYLRDLPATLRELRLQRVASSRGLLAYIGVRTNPPWDPGHVIVDEAQDIHLIEWEVLGRVGNVGGWTILGDMNQRRTDHTFGSWDDIARILAIEDDNDEAPVHVLERGYRSTAQIIRFANQLLPARDRSIFSLQQQGQPPRIHRASSEKNLYSEAIAEAAWLRSEIGRGTIAIITMHPQLATNHLRKEAGTLARGESGLWSRDSEEIYVLPPDRSRGLEFDGVVVVEPEQFPQNLGRNGLLYTALTRANRLLSVVHSKRLPSALKPPR